MYTHLSPMQREQYKNILKRDMDALYQSSGAALTANKSRLTNLVMQLRKCCNRPYLFEGVEDKSLPMAVWRPPRHQLRARCACSTSSSSASRSRARACSSSRR